MVALSKVSARAHLCNRANEIKVCICVCHNQTEEHTSTSTSTRTVQVQWLLSVTILGLCTTGKRLQQTKAIYCAQLNLHSQTNTTSASISLKAARRATRQRCLASDLMTARTERNASERLLVFLQLRKSMSLKIDIDWIKVVAVDEDEDETK